MKKLLTLVLVMLFSITLTSYGKSFYSIKSSIAKKKFGITIRAPYPNVAKYYGYVSKAVTPDGKYKNKDAYYIYFWVPAVIDEVGVAMYSPADGNPGDKDFKHPLFDKLMAAGPKKFFDTYIALDRLVVVDAGKIKDAATAKVMPLATNDDNSEIPKNPSGRAYNSLLRHISQTGNPAKALVRSVYRITFTSFRGNVEGSYLAQIGTNIPGVKVAATLEELHKLVNQ